MATTFLKATSGAIAATVVLALSACDGDDSASAQSAQPTSSASTSSAAPVAVEPSASPAAESDGAYADSDMAKLSSFVPEFADMERMIGARTPLDRAVAYFGSATFVVEPASCEPFFTAQDLGTDQDLGAAGNDLIQPAGPFVPEGSDATRDTFAEGPYAFFTARAFEDPALAATLVPTLVGTDCQAYTADHVEGEGRLENAIASVEEVQLDGITGTTVEIQFDYSEIVMSDTDGSAEGKPSDDANDPEWAYIHVDGPYAVKVTLKGFDDPHHAASSVIADFLAHMSE